MLILLLACVAGPVPEHTRPPDADGDHVADEDDCAPLDPQVSPSASERCNGLDDDCDLDIDEDLPLHTLWADLDEDGYGDPGDEVQACGGEGLVTNAWDCDPGDEDVHPGAEESCDDVDSDCDGDLEDAPIDEKSAWVIDSDGDGYGAVDGEVVYACLLPAGYTDDDTDCDDEDPAVHPDAAEICDPADVDEDCDGAADEADDWMAGGEPMFPDSDGDGYGDVNADLVWRCAVTEGYSLSADDCVPDDPRAFPGAVEWCDDVDDDCDLAVDEEAVDALTWYLDLDADGYGYDATADVDCGRGLPWVRTPGDCDDGDSARHPGASETDCGDPVDYNCDGSAGTQDEDRDGAVACGDCDDADRDIGPTMPEICNGEDDDCDGGVDGPSSVDAILWFEDADGDGCGAMDDPGEWSCEAPPSHVTAGGDCDDSDPWVSPAQTDSCYDRVDRNCDGDTC